MRCFPSANAIIIALSQMTLITRGIPCAAFQILCRAAGAKRSPLLAPALRKRVETYAPISSARIGFSVARTATR